MRGYATFSRPLLVRVMMLWVSLVGLVSMANVATAQQEKRVALIIANSQYTNVPQLKNPANDAAAMATTLRNMGFNSVDVVSNTTEPDLKRALQNFSRKASVADIALVYYAGHGMSIGGVNYLIPSDAKLLADTDVEFEAVSLDLVLRAVSGARRLRIVLLDACRNNPFANKIKSPNRAIGRGLQAVEADNDTVIAFAAKDGSVADDGEGKNSPFAQALVHNLPTPVEIRQLLGQVRDDVRRATGGKQNPYVSQNLGGGAVYLVPPKSPLIKPLSSVAGPAPQPMFDPRQIEMSFWESIRNSKSNADFEAYLKQYPNGAYSGLARNRMAKLTTKSPGPLAAAPKPAAPEPWHPPFEELVPGSSFRDCADCPEMVVIPAGIFTMGSPADESGRFPGEDPRHRVTVYENFAVGKFEVTFAEWDACVAADGCARYRPKDAGWGRGNRPVINVSWNDARAYVAWLSVKTGKQYRLLSESEWEYAARAGTKTAYWWGPTASHDYANFGKDECCEGLAFGSDKWVYTSPVGSFPPNGFGLHDMQGNIWEWVDDCWNDNYAGAPVDGVARTTRNCLTHVLRGGSWYYDPGVMRSASRIWNIGEVRSDINGFRLARTF